MHIAKASGSGEIRHDRRRGWLTDVISRHTHCHRDVVSLPSVLMSATSLPPAPPTNAHSHARHSCGCT
jgi:hypothetical protein